MTLWMLTGLLAALVAALWGTFILVVRHKESDPGGWDDYDTASDDEDTRTAWLHTLATTGAALERQITREFKRRGRLLVGPRRSTVAKRAKARRNGGAR